MNRIFFLETFAMKVVHAYQTSNLAIAQNRFAVHGGTHLVCVF